MQETEQDNDFYKHHSCCVHDVNEDLSDVERTRVRTAGTKAALPKLLNHKLSGTGIQIDLKHAS